jgi:hypothetical protein
MGLGAVSLAKVSNEVTKALQESITLLGKRQRRMQMRTPGSPLKQGNVLNLNQSPRWLFYSFVYVACLC